MRNIVWNGSIVLALVAAIVPSDGVVHGADRTRIFATFVTHNEESVSNPPCQPVLTGRARFLANRDATIEFARVILAGKGAWNFQTEWEYLLRLADWEDEAALERTSGLNLARFLSVLDERRIQVDAHSHELRGYNYADVAYLLNQLGVPPNGIVGGFTWWPVAQQSWTRLRQPLRARRRPSYLWNATILWGAASPGHRNDSRASGIWRPKSAEAFEEDDPSQTLVAVGNYPGVGDPQSAEPIAYLLQRLRAGELEPGRLYTVTIMVPQCDLDIDPALMARAAEMLARFAPDVETGDLVWAPIGEMVRAWREEYDSAPLVAHP